MIKIPAQAFKEAGKILKRLAFAKSSLPVLSHVELRANGETATLAVTDLNLRLEVRVRLAAPVSKAATMLIPHEAFRNAMKADKDSVITFTQGSLGELHSIHLTTCCRGMEIHANYPTLPANEFPARPVVEGASSLLPAKTFAQLTRVAPCSYTKADREILTGVLFSPADGGLLVATDGKRLAGSPAVVPTRTEFVLPNAAVKVLAHQHFLKQASTVTVCGRGDDQLVCFHTKNALLTSRTISGRFPNWKQVVPTGHKASATLGETERASLLSWLTSLKGENQSVTIVPGEPGAVQLHYAQRGELISSVTVPVQSSGQIEPIQLDPLYLATALKIGNSLCFTDSMSPLVVRDADGAFAVAMPMRLTVLPEEVEPLQHAA